MITQFIFALIMTLVSIVYSTFIPTDRLVHLDLKGAPPKISYIEQFFPFIKSLGATGLLIEYEDMFPFWGPIKPLSASNAYTRREIEQILTLAHDNELKVIPLIQTFGHLEFGLKLPEFAKLREVAQHPQALCPSKNGSRELIQNMVDQVMTLHKTSHWLHIGCDEVYQLGQCSSCIQRLRNHEQNWIFLQHVQSGVAE
uniref:beta-N-acetylhexosaminidase n=1 Tax=Strigamia maritima TaxID=126957 RepID=T1JFK9_STRMM